MEGGAILSSSRGLKCRSSLHGVSPLPAETPARVFSEHVGENSVHLFRRRGV